MNNLLKCLTKYVSLSPHERTLLSEISYQRTFTKNETFIQQGEVCNVIGYVSTGAFRGFYTTQEGTEANTEFIIDSGFITDLVSLIKRVPASISMAALETSQVILIDLKKLKKHPELLKKFVFMSGEYMKRVCLPVMNDHQILMAEQASKRYHLLARKYPHYIQRVSQKHIASYLHLRPETISRIRSKFIDLDQFLS